MGHTHLETRLSSRLIKEFNTTGGKVLNLHGHGMQAPGWPDTCVSHKLWSGWIEFKGRNTPISAIQNNVFTHLAENFGKPVFVVRILECNGGSVKSQWKFEITDWKTQDSLVTELGAGDRETAIKLLNTLANFKNMILLVGSWSNKL